MRPKVSSHQSRSDETRITKEDEISIGSKIEESVSVKDIQNKRRSRRLH